MINKWGSTQFTVVARTVAGNIPVAGRTVYDQDIARYKVKSS